MLATIPIFGVLLIVLGAPSGQPGLIAYALVVMLIVGLLWATDLRKRRRTTR